MTKALPDPLERFRQLLEAADQTSGSSADYEAKATALVASLSAPERLILSQIVSGWSTRDMAAAQSVDHGVFMSQRDRLFAKLNAVSTSDAVRIGIYANL